VSGAEDDDEDDDMMEEDSYGEHSEGEDEGPT